MSGLRPSRDLIGTGLIGFTNVGLMGEWFGGAAAIRIIAAEGLIPLVVVGIGWRRLWRLRAGARRPLAPAGAGAALTFGPQTYAREASSTEKSTRNPILQMQRVFPD